MVINLFFVSFSSAIDFTFDSPDSVEINEEFKVVINAGSSENFDVKVFVHNSDDAKIARGEYISEILFEDSWQDPWYYLKESFPDVTEYEIRITESFGERNICVRLRKSDTQSIYTECLPIKIEESLKKEEEPDEEQLEETKAEPVSKTPQVQPLDNQIELPSNEKISLNSPNNTPPEQKSITTKQETKRLWLLYSFTAFCIIIIILLALRKL